MKYLALLFSCIACTITCALELEVGEKLLVIRNAENHLMAFITPTSINTNSTMFHGVVMDGNTNKMWVETDNGTFVVSLSEQLSIDRIQPLCVCRPFLIQAPIKKYYTQ